MMQPLNQSAHTKVQARYPKMVILWAGQLMSTVALVGFSLFLVPESSDIPGTSPGFPVRVVITGLGILLVIVSFVVKRKFLERSVEKQDIDLVQKAFVIAVALCEMSALLGVVQRFLINHRDYYLLFLIAAAGILLHFPRREHLVAATYKASANESTF